MKLILFVFTFFSLNINSGLNIHHPDLNVHHPDLQLYRRLMDQSVENKDTANLFYEKLKAISEDADPSILGFKAMSEFMLCKHLFNPVSRLSHFNKGKNLLEKAIQRNSLDPELLYFRLSTQSNIPAMLRYNSNIKADKQFLLTYLKNGAGSELEENPVYQRIKAYLLINQFCTVQEKELIKNL